MFNFFRKTYKNGVSSFLPTKKKITITLLCPNHTRYVPFRYIYTYLPSFKNRQLHRNLNCYVNHNNKKIDFPHIYRYVGIISKIYVDNEGCVLVSICFAEFVGCCFWQVPDTNKFSLKNIFVYCIYTIYIYIFFF